MKKIIILSAAVMLLVSCSSKHENPAMDAVAKGISESIMKSSGNEVQMYFNSFELIDSTTVGTELLNHKKTFELKIKQVQKLLDKYTAGGQSINANEKKNQLDESNVFIAKIDSLYEALGDKVNDIAYYDYKFSGKAGSVMFEEGYACLTPDNSVLSIKNGSNSGLHKGCGAAVPGYKELFGDNE